MPVVVGVALGGAIGATTRWLLDRFIERHSESVFPWSTFTINVSGCFVLGWFATLLGQRLQLPAETAYDLRLLVAYGFCGGYTTFSTFAQEAFSLIESDDAGVALLYATTSVVLGILAVYAGTLLGRAL